MKVIGVIPVRYDSKRFPGKALALMQGKPLLEHVYERAQKSSILEELVIATDDKRIYAAAVTFAAPVVITPKQYNSGSDRTADAIRSLDCEVVVNIQGDQPLLEYQTIDEAIERLLSSSDFDIVTPIYPMADPKDIADPNIVKVVIDKDGFALYFSRSPIPYLRNKISDSQVYWKHIGIYVYRKDFLMKFAKMTPSPLEFTEGLEQLRILENGYKIMTVQSVFDSPSIDSAEDLAEIGSKV